MDRARIEALLNEVRAGRTEVPDALDRLRDLPFEDIGFAKLDHHRTLRTGMPEVIFARAKPPRRCRDLCPHGECRGNVLATRATREMYEAVLPSSAPNFMRPPAPSPSRRPRPRPARNHRRGLRRNQRPAGGRRGRGHGAPDGQYG